MQRRKRKAAGWIIGLAILLVLLAGFGALALSQGWFAPKNQGHAPRVIQTVGTAELHRAGITTPVAGDIPLQAGDQLSTGDGASLTLRWNRSLLILDSNSQAILTDDFGLGLELTAGQVFVLAQGSAPVTLRFGNQSFTLSDAVGDLSLGEEHQTFYLLSGELPLGQETYTQGQVLTWTQDHISAVPFDVTVLDDFCINAALQAWDHFELCCSREALEQVLADREAQRQAEAQAQLPPMPQADDSSDGAATGSADDAAPTSTDTLEEADPSESQEAGGQISEAPDSAGDTWWSEAQG